MSDVAIKVENLGKQFRIGAALPKYRTLRDTISSTFTAPFRRLRGAMSGQPFIGMNMTEKIWALRHVSFEVKRGEVLGIIGPNGAGKSTLLKILSRITDPTEGSARLLGRVSALLEVGTGFHSELTGRENVYLNAAILGMRRDEINRKFDEIVAFSEIGQFIDTPVKFYSSGMGLRLGFAVAAHLEPEILIVDEVLAVGDAAFQRKCLGKIGTVASEGRTVLFVSHNMQAISALCTHGIVLKKGEIEYYGTVTESVSRYLMADETAIGLEATLENTSRVTNGRAQFERVSITAGAGEARYPIMGEDLQVNVRLRCVRPIRGANVGVEIWSDQGTRLIDANLRMLDQLVDMEADEIGTWTFKLQEVLLRPGKYRIAVYCGIDRKESIDYITHAMYFEMQIDPHNTYGSVDFPGAYRCRFEAVNDDGQAKTFSLAEGDDMRYQRAANGTQNGAQQNTQNGAQNGAHDAAVVRRAGR